MLWSTCHAACAALLLAAPASAQRTFVVDANGGGNFFDIRPAIDAAAPGDTLVVRAGVYGNFAADRGLRVLGDPGVTIAGTRFSSIQIRDVPVGQSAVVRGFAPSFSGISLVISGCAGHVHVENVVAGGPLFATASIVGCRNVTLDGVTVLLPVCESSGATWR
ncbi:MAG: hypothetical protein IPM29_23260 [Planctomycetes bacterium]|nr:hypothetical protein [Planctomycetota bacterium]